jgi:hypothetical protein
MAFRHIGRLRPAAAAAAACACSLALHKEPAESFFARWHGKKPEPAEMYGEYVRRFQARQPEGCQPRARRRSPLDRLRWPRAQVAGDKLGSGTYGVVKLATRRSSGALLAPPAAQADRSQPPLDVYQLRGA